MPTPATPPADMIEKARLYVGNAYAPYSNFRVVSIVRSSTGKLYPGVNVENSSYGLTICAERTAIFNMVTNGEKSIREILVYFPDSEKPGVPCGACLQVISEFSSDNTTRIYVCGSHFRSCIMYTLGELLPYRFKLDLEPLGRRSEE